MHKVKLHKWGDTDVRNLKVGDFAPDCFGDMSEVTEIYGQQVDIKGNPFVCYYTKFSDNGSNISNSMKSGELLRTTELSNHFTSKEIDSIQEIFKGNLLYSKKIKVSELRELINKN